MKRAALVFAFILVGAFCYLFIRESRIIKAEIPTSWKLDQKADCAVVLTGGSGRVREGFDLLAQKQVNKLIISGVNPKASLVDIFPQWPYYGELNERDVVLERRSATTYGNAQQSLPFVEALRCRSVLLITSHLHIYRAYKTFREIYPSEIIIEPRSVVSGNYEAKASQFYNEVFKSIFYSLWAY